MVGAPDRNEAVAEGCDSDIDMDPEGSHEAANGAHEAEHRDVPNIVEHARAVERKAVCVQAKVPVAAKVRVEDVLWMLLQGTPRMKASAVWAERCTLRRTALHSCAGEFDCKVLRPHPRTEMRNSKPFLWEHWPRTSMCTQCAA